MTAIISSSRGMPHLSLMEFARMPNWTTMVGVLPYTVTTEPWGADLMLISNSFMFFSPFLSCKPCVYLVRLS